jgi:hypothetical protein
MKKIYLIIFLAYGILFADTLKVPQDYSTIQSAIDSAKTDDVILIGNKRFSENLIISKRIILVGSYRDSSYIFDYWLNYSKPTISIRADDVVIKNLKVGTRDSKEYTFRIDSSRGTIIQSVTMYADPTMYPGTHILLINSSYDVDIKDVYIEGGKGKDAYQTHSSPGFGAGPGGDAITVINSKRVTIDSSYLSGGFGGNGYGSWPYAPPGLALKALTNSTILINNSNLRYDYYVEPGSSVVLNNCLVSVQDKANTIYKYQLQNYPNPFNPSTTFKYSLPKTERVTLSIYDLLGKEVIKLIDEEKPAGEYETIWNASPYPSGVYFLRMQAGQFNETRKLILMK